MPLNPNELTPAIRLESHGIAMLVFPPACPYLDLWAKFLKCRWGGMAWCCSASITLITPATPDADSRWPILVLTAPTRRRFGSHLLLAQHVHQGFEFDGIAQAGAGAVGFHIADRVGSQTG